MGIRQVGLCDLVLVPKMNSLSLCYLPSVNQTVYHTPDPNVSVSEYLFFKKVYGLTFAMPDSDEVSHHYIVQAEHS